MQTLSQGAEMVEQIEVLKNHAHLLAEGVKGFFAFLQHFPAFEPDAARIGRVQKIHALQQGALAASGRSYQHFERALPHGEGSAFENEVAAQGF